MSFNFCSNNPLLPPADFRRNFDITVEKLRFKIEKSFSDMIRMLEERRELLLQQLDHFARLQQIFPSYFIFGKTESPLLSGLGLKKDCSSQPIYDLKFNLDPNVTNCLRNVGMLQVTLADVLSLPVQKIITSQKSEYIPNKVCWHGDKLFILDTAHKQVDVFDRAGSLLTAFNLQVEIPDNDVTCITASADYLLLTRQSNNIVTYYKHDGTLLPGLPYELKKPVSIASIGEMVAIVDELLHHVLLFQQYSDCVTLIGSQSDRPGELYRPTDVAFTPDNNILVLDHKNPCFHLYDFKAHYLSSFGCSLVGYDATHPSCFTMVQHGVVLLVHMRSKMATLYNSQRSVAYKIRIHLDEMTSSYLFPTGCAAQGELVAVTYADNSVVGVFDASEIKKGIIF